MHLFAPEDFPPDLFRLCKLGGKQIPVGKGLKKRKRPRRKRKSQGGHPTVVKKTVSNAGYRFFARRVTPPG